MLEHAAEGAVGFVEDSGCDREDEVGLGGEVAIDGADADTGRFSDLAHFDRSAVFEEEGAGGIDDALPVLAGIGAGRAVGSGRIHRLWG